jgi:gliding motility-associated-like protein/uncharacterized repeat protein (TIGR01451 family)
VTNPNLAWDNSLATYAALEVNLAGVGGNAQVVYQWAQPVPLNNVMKVTLQFEGTSVLSGIAKDEVFKRLRVQLLNASGTVLETYDNSAPVGVDVVNAAENRFEITLFNPNAATQRIRIQSGDLLSVGLTSQNLRIYDVRQYLTEIHPAITPEATGKVNGLLCIGCGVTNAGDATGSSDPNNDYASLNVPLSLNLGTGYVYSRYNWGGTSYSGAANDVYLVMENPSVASLGTELLFFQNGNISVELTYSDGTKEVVKAGSSLVTASLLGIGSGRFMLKIDANDAKSISKVEVRFGGNLIDAASSLSVYDIFIAPVDPFLEPDIEAVYTINPAKPTNDYVANDILASATDANGAIVSATLNSGILPIGSTLASDGTIRVVNPLLFIPGTYPVVITTTDNKGGTTQSNLSLVINPLDIEAVYTVNAPKPINDYTTNAVLASAVDINGAITSAVVTTGTLPAGTTLAANGTITVTNTGSLVAGSYPLQITTTDEKGGVTLSGVTITLQPADNEAVYTVNPAKPANELAANAVLATATDADGTIVSAALTGGLMPLGTTLSSNGTISVSNPLLLIPGIYPIQVTTTDNKGGTTASNIAITLGLPDIEAIYTINPFKPLNDYATNDILAVPVDLNGAITAAVVTTGTLPAGTAISANGTIRVTTPGSLVAGAYPLQITTTDVLGGTTLSNITLTIYAADIEAVYTVAPAKPLDAYAVNDVLASATDGNGAIVSALLTGGLLPVGAVLESNGTVRLASNLLLVSGSYPVIITTVDDKGGITISNLTIIMNPLDVEAIYTVNPAKPVNDYTASAVLATATDANGTITAAAVTTGSLPAGTSLAANGTITVTTPASLVAGTYPIQVTTTDNFGGTTVSSLSLVLNPADQEAVYTVNPSKPINDYTANATLATATDANGPIVSAVVTSGILPLGTTIASNGTISVALPLVLIPGTYNIQVTTTDDKGGQTASNVSLVLGVLDIEAIYVVNLPKPVNDYTNGAVLATATDLNGPIVSATVTTGTLPAGMAVAADGTVTVSNPATLTAGLHTFTVTTTDNHGGTTATPLTIAISAADNEAVYTVNTPKPANDYLIADVLASATDADGLILSAVVTTGTLPAGTSILATGAIVVTNPLAMTAGTYNIQVTTTDIKGGTTVSNIALVIHPADTEAVYTILPPKALNAYVNGDAIATVTDVDGPIVAASVTTGVMPAGTSIAANGTITVSNPASLVAGTYAVGVTTTDSKGGRTFRLLALVLDPTAQADIEAVYTVNPAKPRNDYSNGNVLAAATDANGPIVLSVVTTGSLPAGTALAADGTITVSNVGALVAGTHNFQVTTTDDTGGTTASNLSITFNPTDVEAVYTVNPAKPVNDYANNAVLATVTDANGPIVSAVVTTGTLPAGVTLAADGTVTVSNPASVVAGTYNVSITTTDNKGGMTTSNVALVLHAADIEAVYTVNPAKPVNDYANNNVLATVTDANGAITAATVTTGSLPAGTAIAADGTIRVSAAGSLAAGTYTFTVTTTDNQGGTTASPIALTIHAADVEAVYTINPPKPVNDYTANAVLATVTDANGPIVSAIVTTGTLPAGVTLASDGVITVTNPGLLAAGTYTIQVTTTDNQGGTTTSSVSLVIHAADIEAVYTVAPAKPVSDYATNAVLASATDANGAITAATVTSGALPAGTTLAADGTIRVTTPGSLLAGTYTLQVTTTDAQGGMTASDLSLVINQADIEAVYTLNPSKPVNDYANNDVLATATDGNGAIVAASVTTGALPAGVSLAANGALSIVNMSALVAGTYSVGITTTDEKGGTTLSNLSIVFGPADIEAVYTVAPPRPVNEYTNGAVLASATDANGPIVAASVTPGPVPPGTALAANGTLTVSDVSALVAGTYTIQVTTTDDKGGTTVSNLSITLNAADVEAVYTVNTPKPVNDYADNAVLATATDANGAIVSAVVTTGTLPAGTVLESNGTIKVFNAATLAPGTYALGITTTDEHNGTTLSNISVVIRAADIEAVYAVMQPKPVNDYAANDALATVTDANGAIVSATVTNGTLPAGVTLAANGTVSATTPAQLVAGTYTFDVTTTDDQGGITLSTLSLTFNPADQEAVYTILPPKTVTDYTHAEALATVVDPNGPIISAVVTTGTLPLGIVLDNDGTIRVGDPTHLVAGTYTFTVTTTDVNGGVSATVVTIVLPAANIVAGVAKAVGTPQLQADGSYRIPYTLVVENFGNISLTNIQVTDDLAAAFPAPATLSVVPGSLTTGTLVINPTFNGKGDLNLLASTSHLDAGKTATIVYTVQVALNGSTGTFNNSAHVITKSDDGSLTYIDQSDDGNDPDPNGNSNPSDAGENDPTPVQVTPHPVLGVAKAAGTPLLKADGSYDIQYTVTLENLGNEALSSISVTDNLANAFPMPATYTMVGAVSATGSLLSNTAFNGTGETNLLLAGSTLSNGATQTVTYTVNVQLNGSNVPFYNSATGTAQGNGSGDTYTDISTNGFEADPNGNGNPSDPGEDQPTGVALTPNLVAGVAKTATVVQQQPDGSYRVTYSLEVENLGNLVINNIQVTDDLAAAFPSPATFTVLSGSVATGTLSINPSFNGSSDVNLLAPGSTLKVGATHSIGFIVSVNLNSGAGTFSNSATVTAMSDDGMTSSVDVSDSGTEPDPNGNGDPTEAGENDPTVVELKPNPVLGVAKAASIPLSSGDGAFLVTYTFTVENLGSVILNNVQVTDNLAAAFALPVQFAVTEISTSGALAVNTAYNGSTDVNLLAANNSLSVGTSQQFTVTVRIDPDDLGGAYANSAYGTAAGVGNAGMTSDISTNGLDPDPNGNGNPGDAGEDRPTTITLDLLPVIGVAKAAAVPILQPDDSYDVTFTFTLENLGNTSLRNIELIDVLSLVFPPEVTFSMKTAPVSTGALVPNATFNGVTNPAILDKATSTLAIGARETVTFTVNVVPSPGNIGPFYNAAAAYASNEDLSKIYGDISTNGTEPDPNGNGDPNDVNESTRTPFMLEPLPLLGVGLWLSEPVLDANENYIVNFSISLRNMGNDVLEDVHVDQSLRDALPMPMTFTIQGAPTVTGDLVINTDFNGDADTVLVDNGVIEVGEENIISFTAVIDANDVFGTFWLQAIGSGEGVLSDDESWDLSNNGEQEDVDGDGRPDEASDNRPTPLVLRSYPSMSLLKTIADIKVQQNCTYDVTYSISYQNHGNTSISNVEIVDNLASVILAPATYSVVSVTTPDDDNLVLNPAYDGKTVTNLLANGDYLEIGEHGTILLTVNIDPNGFYGPFGNMAQISGVITEGDVNQASNDRLQEENVEAAPTVVSLTEAKLFIPEGFSPNGDGIHDTFTMVLNCGITADVKIYNRWGDKVYSNGDYKGEWNGEANAGSFGNKPLPDGTYFFTAELSNGAKITNYITIKR